MSRYAFINDMENDPRRVRAAITIQRWWRTRYAEPLDAAARWQDAIDRVQLKVGTSAAIEGNNSPKSRWRRATMIAARIRDRNDVVVKSTGKPQIEVEPSDRCKILETQHWLELIDGKHRYGSNLKSYHRRWLSEDTTENFFHWLDRGAGRCISLPECPRERLESERILYLSAEQRLNYLVKIDKEGKLRWARNNHIVDTIAGVWRDLGNGGGIGPVEPTSEITSPSQKQESHDNLATLAEHYTAPKKRSKYSKIVRNNFTPTGIMDKLLRRTVKQNTWIYVTDKHYNLFMGIKVTGSFQHSSFLSGGLVTSAGLVSVENGVIRKLSPLSGHYRTSIEHFKNMVKVLNDQGAHLGRLDINKAEVVLWGVSRYAKVKNFSRSVFYRPGRRPRRKKGLDDKKQVKIKLTIAEKRRDILYGRRYQLGKRV